MSLGTNDAEPADPRRVSGATDHGPWRRQALRMALTVLSVWAGLLADPWMSEVASNAARLLGGVLVLLAVALGLGWLGLGLFAAGERFAGWVRQASRWPDENEESDGFPP